MKKLLYIITLVILLANCSTEETGGTFNGDVILNTQDEINLFGGHHYERVTGYLHVAANFQEDDITDLSPLNSIKVIDGKLLITGVSYMPELHLNITHTGGLWIESMHTTEIISFPYLMEVTDDGMNILRNDALTTLNFPDLESVKDRISFHQNANLTTIHGMPNLNTIVLDSHPEEQITSIAITENPVLNSIDEFNSLFGQVYYLKISQNPHLTSLEGLQNLSLGVINISFNEVLTDYCAIGEFISAGETVDGQPYEDGSTLMIFDNAYNPNLQNFLDGDCSP